jgi:hypothetical protein
MKSWQKLSTKITIWLAAEVLLSLIGLDDLADYSEFILDQKGVVVSSNVTPGLIIA